MRIIFVETSYVGLVIGIFLIARPDPIVTKTVNQPKI